MLNHSLFQRPRLRIVLATMSLQPGGAERWLATLAQQFQAFEVTAIVNVAGDHGPIATDIPRDIPIYQVDPNIPPGHDRWYPFQALLRKACRRGADIILGWGPMRIPDIATFPVPVVLCSHGLWDIPFPERPTAHYLTGVSEGSLKAWPASLRKEATVIYNGVPLDRLDPLYQTSTQLSQWGITDLSAKILLYNGRFSTEKNPEAVLRSLTHLPDNWVCVMHGWGDLQSKLMHEIAPSYARPSRYTKSTNILFPKPSYRNIGSLYRAANVVCIPSHREAFPLVMIESWLSEVPVVITDQPIVSELSNTFRLETFPAKVVSIDPTPSDLAAAIIAADTAPPSEKERARDFAARYFTAAHMIRRWEDYLFSCIQEWQSSSFTGEVQFIDTGS